LKERLHFHPGGAEWKIIRKRELFSSFFFPFNQSITQPFPKKQQTPSLSSPRLRRDMKNRFFGRGERRSGREDLERNLWPFGFRRASGMKTFNSIQWLTSHHIKEPHSKTSEPDCLSPLPIATQSRRR
jgi:hypothetical protein